MRNKEPDYAKAKTMPKEFLFWDSLEELEESLKRLESKKDGRKRK